MVQSPPPREGERHKLTKRDVGMRVHTCSFDTLGAREAPEGHIWLLQPQQKLIWHLEPLGLGGKVAAAPPHPQALQGAETQPLGLIS